MSEDTLLPFDLPSVARKKLTVGFDGGQLSSDAGALLLRGAERKIRIGARLAACIRDRRKPERIEHPLEEMLKLWMFAIASGYEDGDDCDTLRHDPIFKMTAGHEWADRADAKMRPPTSATDSVIALSSSRN